MGLLDLFGLGEAGWNKQVARLGEARDVPGLIAALNCRHWPARCSALHHLGEIGDAGAVDPIVLNLWRTDRCGVFNEAAAVALGRIKDARAIQPLLSAVERLLGERSGVATPSHLQNLGKAINALVALGDEQVARLLAAVLMNPNHGYDKRLVAARGLALVPDGRERLNAALTDSDLPTRVISAKALRAANRLPSAPAQLAHYHIVVEAWEEASAVGAAAVAPLCAAIRSNSWTSEETPAMRALRNIQDPEAKELLLAALGDEDSRVRVSAAKALGALRAMDAVQPLLAILAQTCGGQQGRYKEFRIVAEVLGLIGSPEGVAPLIQYLDIPESRCAEVALALGQLGDPHAVGALLAVVAEPKNGPATIDGAWSALAMLGNPEAIRHCDALERRRSEAAETERQKREKLREAERMQGSNRRATPATGHVCQRCQTPVEPRNQKCPGCGIDLIFFARKY